MRRHALAIAPLIMLGSAATAQPGLYIAEYQFQNARLASIAADGTNPQEVLLLPSDMWLPLGLTYDAATDRLIWMDSAGPSDILSTPAAGGGAITPLGAPSGFCRGVNLDAAGRVYFSSSQQLQRLETDGSITPLYTSPLGDVLGMPEVDATNGHVYVNDAGQILRMNLDGTNVKTIFTGCSRATAIGLDVAGGYIYWADADTISDYVGRVRLDGSGFEILHDLSPSVVQSSGLIDILVDPAGNALYYADELAATLSKAALDGSGAAPIYTSDPGRTISGLVLQTGEVVQPMLDCNNNGVADDVDIAGGAPDCDNNGRIDTCQTVNPCERVFLLDHESDAANSQARAVGWPSEWEIFQPFDVPASTTWTIGEIGLDGFTGNFVDGSGMTVHLYPDDGSMDLPDETNELASTTINLTFNTRVENWVYAPLSATLAPGRYWVVLEANDPVNYAGNLNFGNFGEFSKSRGASGNFTASALPIAMRLVLGAACAADLDGNSTVDVFDLLAYLDLWFVADAAAELTGDSPASIDVFDLLAYLDAWFAGCD